ncbi:MAG: 50S ribosomal protein L31 [Patescibacteria group bacterium]|jgi:large subunit ribosomal protein L31
MKTTGHPKYYTDAAVSCACGNTFTTGSTKKSINVEVCYKCHPLFTGEEKLVDIKGQVEKFRAKMAVAKEYAARPKKADKKAGRKEGKSLKDLLSMA